MNRLRDHMEKLSLRSRHRDVRQRGAVFDCRLEHRVSGLEQAGGVRVSGIPTIVIHRPAV
jgi:hypothetical protein